MPRVLRVLVYRVCFAVACASGTVAADYAAAFRSLGRASRVYGPVVVLAQLPVALLWAAARGLFLVSAAPCYAIARGDR
jgi:hypothetical protein